MSQIIQYKLDLTGTSSENHITDVVHVAVPNPSGTFIVIPTAGAFYDHDLVLKTAGGAVLPASDYHVGGRLEKLSFETGRGAYRYIVVENTGIGATIMLSAHVVGGIYSVTSKSVQDALDEIFSGTDTVDWEKDITDKPFLFPQAAHKQDIDTVYGFEYITAELNKLSVGIRAGDKAMWDDAYARINGIRTLLGNVDAQTESSLNAHLTNFSNPHEDTPAKIGAATLQDMNTLREALILEANQTLHDYIHTTAAGGLDPLTNAMGQHIQRKDDPHNITPEQLGTISQTDRDTVIGNFAGLNQDLHAKYDSLVNRRGEAVVTNAGFGADYGDSYRAYFYVRYDGVSYIIGLNMGGQWDAGRSDNIRIEYDTGRRRFYIFLLNNTILDMANGETILLISDVERIIAENNCKCACNWNCL